MYGVVYHMALRLYSLVRHKEYAVAIDLAKTLINHLETLKNEESGNAHQVGS